ncbi:MAG: hypothetical protein ACPGXZ_06630 [Saprospiraceae bacterium]
MSFKSNLEQFIPFFNKSETQLSKKDLAHLSKSDRKRTQAAHQRFTNNISDKSHVPPHYDGIMKVKYLYTCNSGINWYMPSGEMRWDNIPKAKRDYINMVIRMLQYGDTPKWHIENYDKINQAIDQNQSNLVKQYIAEGKHKIESLNPDYLDTELSANLFIADFELDGMAYHVNPDNIAEKRKLIENDTQLRMFFFRCVKRLFTALTDVKEVEFSKD